MAPSVSPTIAARREQMFPILTDADIERMRRFGEARAYDAAEHIVTAGTVSPGLILILSGKVEITQAGELGRGEAIITYGSGNFIGELAQLSNRPSLVNAEAA
ncbi:MAG: cyclic nucleotide-binding domain-containing protein, partial [Mesorhizobium sp.]